MSLGTQLRKARLDKKLSSSQVAAATRMKVQIVEALEQEAFEKIAAPIYGKGFIRLYAEFVGLDPEPLVAEYVARISPRQPTLVAEEPPAEPPAERPPAAAMPEAVPAPVAAASASEPDLFAAAAQASARPAQEPSPGAGSRPPAAVPPRRPPAPPEAASGESRNLFAVLGDGVRGLVKAFSGSDRAESQRRTVTANQPKMEGERFPLAGISVAIAVVVAVIIVVEIVRSWRAPAPHPPAGRSSEPVRTAIEPPPPYVD